MSTQLMNDAGDIVAVAFAGRSDQGPMSNVRMPRSVAGMVGSMPVFEEAQSDVRTTLSAWIADQESAGRTVRYEGSLKLDKPPRAANELTDEDGRPYRLHRFSCDGDEGDVRLYLDGGQRQGVAP